MNYLLFLSGVIIGLILREVIVYTIGNFVIITRKRLNYLKNRSKRLNDVYHILYLQSARKNDGIDISIDEKLDLIKPMLAVKSEEVDLFNDGKL